MPNPTDDRAQTAAAIAGLTEALQRVEVRFEAARRAERRLRVGLFLSALAILGGAAFLAFDAITDFVAQIAPPPIAHSDPAAAQGRRERLLAGLPAGERARLQQFETQLKLVREYVEVSPHFDAGATVALMLSNMSRSVEVMPKLYAVVDDIANEMRAINGRMADMDRKMDALPVLATEVQGMRGQLAVMAAGVDSTMGRAGRMLPWSW
jgi:hypothetical protein